MPRGFAPGNLRVGVIGCGWQGHTHARCYAALPNATVVAVCDLDADKARTVAQEVGAGSFFTDYNELLAREDIEAVSVVLPDHLHRPVCEAAFSAGKHVLLEKPMATTLADAQAIFDAWQRAGTKLMINWSNRWQLPFAQIKEALDRGDLGEPLYCYARLNNTLFVPTRMLSWAAQTELPFWLISHRFDIARWYFQSEAKRVHAVARTRVLKAAGIDTPDFYQATVEFENGAVGNFESCWILPETMPSIVDSKFELICTRGYASFDAAMPVTVISTGTSYETKGFIFGDVHGEPRGFVFDAIAHFVNCVLLDEEPMITGHDGLAVTRALVAMVESARTGQVVEL
ncbi:MAG: Gfo/Idh/MocA family oxidoreductase [Armatimonadetes bacterium]|nr:Gfo/Idh/MocA family oxidoreductase [Armatimonadota bacterium]